MEDDRTIPPRTDRSWIDLSNETDEWGMRRAYVNLVATKNDRDLWADMDEASFALAAQLAGSPADIEYWNKPANQWQAQRPQPGADGRGFWQDAFGVGDAVEDWFPQPTCASGRSVVDDSSDGLNPTGVAQLAGLGGRAGARCDEAPECGTDA